MILISWECSNQLTNSNTVDQHLRLPFTIFTECLFSRSIHLRMQPSNECHFCKCHLRGSFWKPQWDATLAFLLDFLKANFLRGNGECCLALKPRDSWGFNTKLYLWPHSTCKFPLHKISQLRIMSLLMCALQSIKVPCDRTAS